ncbi:hypothetical protein, partial [Frisingicoccus sp.]|uniref:hypothetical protein n=1 Tax=Frisingicoccus sp. TaxID=1918627 RepID=UPI0037370AC8
PWSQGHVFHARMKNMTLGPIKHEKEAIFSMKNERISNVFRILRASNAEKSVGIMGQILLTPTS